MAMLAEPRRKQRVGPNPRGKFFTEDEDNKGRNLLQKMGWKSGDGLGVQRQGIKDPIRPKIQSDAKGLGFDIKSDAWVSHTDDFNAILQNLQAAHGVGESVKEEETEMTTTAGFGFDLESQVQGSSGPSKSSAEDSLETKSKASRSRIHYHKFVKNKDLSKIKDKDWGCIFGKDVTQRQQDHVVEKEFTQGLTIAPPPPSIDYSSLQLNGNPAQNRYKLQMLKSFTKSTLLEDQLEPFDGKKAGVEVVEKLQEPNDIEQDQEVPRKKKKKSKNKDKSPPSSKSLELEVDMEVVEKSQEPCDIDVEQDEEVPRKKKKKSKNKEKSPQSPEPLELEVRVVENVTSITQEEEPKRKKKSKNNEKSSKLVEPEVCASVEVVEQEADEPRKKKKKSKKEKKDSSSPETVTAEEVVAEEEDNEAPPSKKKKKSKKRSPSPETIITTAIVATNEEPTHPKESLEISAINTNRRTISAVEMHAAAAVFKGSNLLEIPGYRNQSSKLL